MHLASPQSEQRSGEIGVFTPGQLVVQHAEQVNQRRNASAHANPSAAWVEHAGDQPEERRFAGAVSADDSEGLAAVDLDVDSAQCLMLNNPAAAAPNDELLQRETGIDGDPITDADVVQAHHRLGLSRDAGCHRHSG